VRPVGSEESRKVDVRIIAATNRNLQALVEEGKFREDLYFRLSMFHIHVPPLRERRADISDLIDHVLRRLERESGRTMSLDPEAREILIGYSWPGNVRQLENIVSRAHILADGDLIRVEDLPPEVAIRRQEVALSVQQAAVGGGSLREQVRRFEAAAIAKALEDASGDRRAAAQRLEIGLSSLYRKIEELADYGLVK
jgi:two-component system response regulator AtoC